MIKVREIMTKDLLKTKADQTIREAIGLMTEYGVGSLVVQKGQEIVGILEESDIIKKVLAGDLNPYITTVEKVMSVPFVIHQEKSDDEASDLMVRQNVRRLVVSDGSAIVGILSMQDLLRPVYAGKSFWT
jgi:CBS domain-containing protein